MDFLFGVGDEERIVFQEQIDFQGGCPVAVGIPEGNILKVIVVGVYPVISLGNQGGSGPKTKNKAAVVSVEYFITELFKYLVNSC